MREVTVLLVALNNMRLHYQGCRAEAEERLLCQGFLGSGQPPSGFSSPPLFLMFQSVSRKLQPVLWCLHSRIG